MVWKTIAYAKQYYDKKDLIVLAELLCIKFWIVFRSSYHNENKKAIKMNVSSSYAISDMHQKLKFRLICFWNLWSLWSYITKKNPAWKNMFQFVSIVNDNSIVDHPSV